MSEHTVKLTGELIDLLLKITGPRIATDPENRYSDWSVDLDRRLRAALLSPSPTLIEQAATEVVRHLRDGHIAEDWCDRVPASAGLALVHAVRSRGFEPDPSQEGERV